MEGILRVKINEIEAKSHSFDTKTHKQMMLVRIVFVILGDDGLEFGGLERCLLFFLMDNVEYQAMNNLLPYEEFIEFGTFGFKSRFADRPRGQYVFLSNCSDMMITGQEPMTLESQICPPFISKVHH
ncbi:MAG: hypothetical protein WCN88_05070 [Candidatus Falkowbacteria bacterium]